jgi:hypothetical protein
MLDTNQTDQSMWLPNAQSAGAKETGVDLPPVGKNAYGFNLIYDYTDLVHADTTAADVDTRGTMVMLGSSTIVTDAGGNSFFPLIYNWTRFRHNFTPSATADDIEENAFSKVFQQGQTADSIIDIVEDEQDEKPYNLLDFTDSKQTTLVSTVVGSPSSDIICVPLGLGYLDLSAAGSSVEIELVGITEL